MSKVKGSGTEAKPWALQTPPGTRSPRPGRSGAQPEEQSHAREVTE